MKYFILKLLVLALNILYLPFKLLETQNKIVMISRQSNKINDDFALLGKELEDDFDVVYLCKTLDGGIESKLKDKISYGFHIFTQMYHLATSKACILDSYCIVACILKHKKHLKIVQIWHSIGTLKQFGWQITDRKEGSNSRVAEIMKMHQNYDVVYCAGEAYKAAIAEGFNLPVEKFKIFTLPRIDLLKDGSYLRETRAAVFKRYPQLKQKQNVVYAPTFRKDESEFEKYFSELANCFDYEKYNLVVKLHPLSEITIDNDNIVVDRDFSTFQMITIAHKFISDYSCVIYEAGVAGVPLYFYNYDMEHYKDVRSLTINYDELPGFKSCNALELITALDNEYDYDYLKEYINKYVENTEKCTFKMAKDIKSLINFTEVK